jgi:hypothetical protein
MALRLAVAVTAVSVFAIVSPADWLDAEIRMTTLGQLPDVGGGIIWMSFADTPFSSPANPLMKRPCLVAVKSA